MNQKLPAMTPEHVAELRAIADRVNYGLAEFKRLAVPHKGFRLRYTMAGLQDRAAKVLESAMQD